MRSFSLWSRKENSAFTLTRLRLDWYRWCYLAEENKPALLHRVWFLGLTRAHDPKSLNQTSSVQFLPWCRTSLRHPIQSPWTCFGGAPRCWTSFHRPGPDCWWVFQIRSFRVQRQCLAVHLSYGRCQTGRYEYCLLWAALASLWTTQYWSPFRSSLYSDCSWASRVSWAVLNQQGRRGYHGLRRSVALCYGVRRDSWRWSSFGFRSLEAHFAFRKRSYSKSVKLWSSTERLVSARETDRHLTRRNHFDNLVLLRDTPRRNRMNRSLWLGLILCSRGDDQ